MQAVAADSTQAAAKITQLEQHIQQLQHEANTAGALEYRCEGLLQDKQQLTQQLQQLKGSVAQMQATLHQERIWRQDQEALCAKIEAEKLQIQNTRNSLEAKLKAAEQRASEAEEEQLRSEQELASARAELQTVYSRNQSQIFAHSDDSGGQLGAAPISANNLHIALASSRSALTASEAQLTAANERIQQLELSAGAPSKQLSAADGHPNGVSQLHTGLKGTNGIFSSTSASGSNAAVSHSTNDIVQKLKDQVTNLKASRDRLLLQVDSQLLESEHLSSDNAALEQALTTVQQSAETWEAHAQDSLQQLDQLKSLLEESAFWQSHTDALNADDRAANNSQGDPTMPNEAELQKEVLQEKARATSLEVQVRALCLELARARQNAGILSQSIAPTLTSIGSRLGQLLQVSTA